MDFIFAYFLTCALIGMTLGLILFSEYKFRKALFIILIWPIWVPLIVAYILWGILYAFIYNHKMESAFKEVEHITRDWSIVTFIEKFLEEKE